MGKKFKPQGGVQGKLNSGEAKNRPALDHPVFCFRYLRNGYGIDDLENDAKVSLVDSLWRASQKTWIQLENTGHLKGGVEKIPASQLLVGLPPSLFDDRLQVYVLGFLGKVGKIVGYREGQVFHVIWISPSHATHKG